MNYSDLCIETSSTVRDAMRNIDASTKKIAFVLEHGALIASVTDGDIRRYLLAGNDLSGCVMECANRHPRIAHDREEAEKLLRLHELNCIPIVDGQRHIKSLAFQREAVSNCPRLQLPTVIMAGGKGTRLEPFTKVLPKPLVPVGDLPIIEHIMNRFARYDCQQFHLIVNHKKQLIKAYFAESDLNYEIHYYDEDKPLGTGGGLAMLRGKIGKTFFLTNCDVLIDADYGDMLDFHQKSGNVITMICAYKNLQIPYGVIDMGVNGSIVGMCEKPEFSFLTNTGMYLVEPCVLEDIQENVPIGFPDIIDAQRERGRQVSVYPVNESCWMDMGQLTELEKMRERLEVGR